MTNYLDAENAVVGSILIDPRCLPDVSQILSPEDFGSEVNKALYRAALELSAKGQAVDPVLIRRETEKAGNAVPEQYILQLMDSTPTAANAKEYAELTRENAIRRGVLELATRTQTEANEGGDPHELLAQLLTEADALEREGVNNLVFDPVEQALEWMEHRDRIDSGVNKVFLKTGFRSLDNILGGLIKGGSHIVAARPGNGKTTLAINIAENIAKNGHPVLYVSLEMDEKQIYAKRIAKESGLDSRKVMSAKLTEKEYKQHAFAVDTLMARPLYINRKPNASVDDIAIMARKIKGLEMVVIDYIGITDPDKSTAKSSRYEQITVTSRKIKLLARKMDIPVLVLCQINREIEKRHDKRPTMADLRDSGAIEQDADTITFLHQKEYFGRKQDLDQHVPLEVECTVAKNRHGPTGECKFAFFPATSRFLTSDSAPRTGAREAIQNGVV